MNHQLAIGLADARVAVAAVLASIKPIDSPLAIAVVDAEGQMVYLMRQDGASAVDVRNAERKAYTAAFIGRDTSMWRLQILHDGRTVADWANPNLTTIHGGWTLRRESQVIGGIGGSGAGEEERGAQLRPKGGAAGAQRPGGGWRQRREPQPPPRRAP